METWDYAWVSIITSVFDEKCWWCLIVHSFGPIPRSTSGLLQWRQMAAPFFSLLSPSNILSHHHLGQLQLDNIVTCIYHKTNFAVIGESSSWLASSQWRQMTTTLFPSLVPHQHIVTSVTSMIFIISSDRKATFEIEHSLENVHHIWLYRGRIPDYFTLSCPPPTYCHFLHQHRHHQRLQNVLLSVSHCTYFPWRI